MKTRAALLRRVDRKVPISKHRTGIDGLVRRDETGELAPARALFAP